MLVKVSIVFFVLLFLIGAFFVSEQNYKKHLQIKYEYVHHPESLPKPEVALRTTFGFSNLIADKYWLQTIQYIGGNAIDSAYKKFLFAMLDIITTLNPYFDHPYIIWMLLLPGSNEMYEDFSEQEQEMYTKQAVRLWEKWVQNFCDLDTIAAIDKEFDLEKIWNDPQYRNPCKNDMIPYSLAFVYYFYMNEPLKAAKYYKVASAVEWSIEWAKVMSAIMQGKWWDREKSIYMLLTMGRNIEPDDEVCRTLSTEIEKIMNGLKSWEIYLSGKMLQDIAAVRAQVFWEFNEETKEKALSDTSCQNYVNKATREMNLLYLDLANTAHKEANEGKPAMSGEELLEKWFIDAVPRDFQVEKDFRVIYKYNEKTGNFDYESWGL